MLRSSVMISFLLLTLGFVGCQSKYQTVSRNEVDLGFSSLSKDSGHYEYTGTVSTEVEMSYFLFFASENNLNYRRGDFGVNVDNLSNTFKISDRTFDYAMYKLAKDNPDVDYFTNVRVDERVEEKNRFLYITWARTSKITIKAQAVELKTNE